MTPTLYIVHSYAFSDVVGPSTGSGGDLSAASAPLTPGSPRLRFEKWDRYEFSSQQPGLGGNDGPILPSGGDNAYVSCADASQHRSAGSISYIEDTQQYLLTFVCASPTNPARGSGKVGYPGAAWFFATTTDLAHQRWSTPVEIGGSWSRWDPAGDSYNPAGDSYNCNDFNGWYPTFMSLGKKPSHLSMSGYVFYLHGCLGSTWHGQPPRAISSRAFTITVEAP